MPLVQNSIFAGSYEGRRAYLGHYSGGIIPVAEPSERRTILGVNTIILNNGLPPIVATTQILMVRDVLDIDAEKIINNLYKRRVP